MFWISNVLTITMISSAMEIRKNKKILCLRSRRLDVLRLPKVYIFTSNPCLSARPVQHKAKIFPRKSRSFWNTTSCTIFSNGSKRIGTISETRMLGIKFFSEDIVRCQYPSYFRLDPIIQWVSADSNCFFLMKRVFIKSQMILRESPKTACVIWNFLHYKIRVVHKKKVIC